jgi:spermidine synthase
MASLARPARITVAEISPAVLRWFEGHSGPHHFGTLPEHVTFVTGDVRDCLGPEARWDVILLDVDNGPAALSAAGNAALYDEAGLRAGLASLEPGGTLLVWSSFEDPGFEARAREIGFSVSVHPIAIAGRPEPFHYVFALGKRGEAPADQVG